MSDIFSTLLSQVLAADAPVLPVLRSQQVWLHLGWSAVLGWVGVWLAAACRLPRSWHWAVAAVLGAWAWVPGELGASYWLGLAFQAPAITTVCLCLSLLMDRWHTRDVRDTPARGAALYLCLVGGLAGWVLLLDSFAVLPWQLYALGFSPVVPALAVLVALMPWVVVCCVVRREVPHGVRPAPAVGCVLVVVLVFTAMRVPTGNAWDALLDPLLWLVLNGVCIRALSSKLRSQRSARVNF